ncbi:toll/interleukin-1 receptor domain-containing protein [Pontiella sp.]|uniref:toll/interleukin-1 receptor domain-containing protein n=1 Tax=Pontiella sp. TaxID=2837462 RepID=UPI0035631F45
MPDVFISYSVEDSEIAQNLYKSCCSLQINTFLAEISLSPGNHWKGEIIANLKQSKWFLFLATPNSLKSDAVKHEIGAALALDKTIIPILHEVDYDEIPSWVSDHQGIKMVGENIDHVRNLLTKISDKIKGDKVVAGLLIGVLIGAGIYMLAKD